MTGDAGPRPGRFDPRPYVRRLENGAEYLDVKWRLHWMRSEHPDAQIDTQLLYHDEERAVCKATVVLPNGGAATAHASAVRTGGSGQVEQAETRAIGRALASLGYGAEYTEEDIVPVRPGERPMSLVPPPPVRPRREPEPESAPAGEEPAPPASRSERMTRTEYPERDAEPRSPTRIEERPARPERPHRVEPAPTATPAADRADVSWTRFWDWAKNRGYRDAAHLKELLGIDVMAHTPAEVRRKLIEYEVEHPPPGRDE